MRISYLFILLTLPIFIFSNACSSANDRKTDLVNLPALDGSDTTLSLAESASSRDSSILGIYNVEIDPDSLTADMNLARTSSMLGDSYNVNLTPFLTNKPCMDCLIIHSIGLTPEGYIELRIQTRHPFKPLIRYDLHLFDLRAIVVTDRNLTTFDKIRLDLNGDGQYESAAWGNFNFLINPDGYTSFNDIVIEPYTHKFTSGNLAPFINLWVNPSTVPGQGTNYDPASEPSLGFTDIEHPTGQNVFPMGSDFTDPLSVGVMQFNVQRGITFSFNLILEASYGHTATKETRMNPRYFLPEFHRKDPLYVHAELTRNDLWELAPLSSADLEIKVADWQAGLTSLPDWNYSTSPITSIRNKSDVREIIFDVPGILNNPVTSDLSKRIAGTGSYWDPYKWRISFTNEMVATKGIYHGLIAVRDDLEGTQSAPYGIANSDHVPVIFTDLSVYQHFEVVVKGTNQRPVADLKHSSPDNELDNNEIVFFEPGPFTMDPDGAIIKYEYDYGYNGTDFIPDKVQNSGEPDFGQPVSFQFQNPGNNDIIVRVGFRVTDDGVPAETDIDSESFIVYPTLPDPTILFEDFETTTGGNLPSNWGYTGFLGDAYYCNTLDKCCKDTTWQWGVTENESQCIGGETKFANDNGKAIPTHDPDESYQNRAMILYTPEFTVPTRGATVTIEHKFAFTFAEYQGTHYLDGGAVILSEGNPGVIEWTDFCYSQHLVEWNHPKRLLPVVNGPEYGKVSDKNHHNQPLCDFDGHVGISDDWSQNQYFISPVYAGQKVRVGFVVGTCDPDMAGNDCPQSELPPYLKQYLTIGHGWRLNWVKIERVL